VPTTHLLAVQRIGGSWSTDASSSTILKLHLLGVERLVVVVLVYTTRPVFTITEVPPTVFITLPHLREAKMITSPESTDTPPIMSMSHLREVSGAVPVAVPVAVATGPEITDGSSTGLQTQIHILAVTATSSPVIIDVSSIILMPHLRDVTVAVATGPEITVGSPKVLLQIQTQTHHLAVIAITSPEIIDVSPTVSISHLLEVAVAVSTRIRPQ
jgi:hypothetical protein